MNLRLAWHEMTGFLIELFLDSLKESVHTISLMNVTKKAEQEVEEGSICIDLGFVSHKRANDVQSMRKKVHALFNTGDQLFKSKSTVVTN
jgi:hypothetical protein